METTENNKLLRVFWISLISLPLTLIALNIIVDPFWYFNLVKISPFSKNKPQFAHDSRMAKAQHIIKQRPANIILGGSRAELGLNTTHIGWKNYPGVTYNIGLAGTGIWEMSKTLEHAYYGSGKLKFAVVNIDFLMFNRFLEDVVFDTVVVGFDKKRLMSAHDSRLKKILYDIDSLIGYKATKRSYESILCYLGVKPTSHVDYRSDGKMEFTFNEEYKKLHDKPPPKEYCKFNPEKSDEEQYGQELAFVQKTWRAGPDHRYCFTNLAGKKSTFDDYEAMLRFAHEHHIKLKFMISPEHANMLIALQEAGLWVLFEDWKKQLVSINEKVAREFNKKPFDIWDFSGFNDITTALRQDIMKQYYWEPSHYRESVGNLMFDIVLSNKKSRNDFGVLLNKSTLQKHLDDTLVKSKHYAKNEFVLHLKDAIAKNFAAGQGSTCGFCEDKLFAAAENNVNSVRKVLISEAIQLFEEEKKKHKQRGVPFREAGFLKKLAKYEAGEKILRPLENWQKYQERGTLALSRNEHSAAIADFSEAITREKGNAALYFQRGTAYLALKQYSKAATDFLNGLKLDPNNATLKQLYTDASNKGS